MILTFFLGELVETCHGVGAGRQNEYERSEEHGVGVRDGDIERGRLYELGTQVVDYVLLDSGHNLHVRTNTAECSTMIAQHTTTIKRLCLLHSPLLPLNQKMIHRLYCESVLFLCGQ